MAASSASAALARAVDLALALAENAGIDVATRASDLMGARATTRTAAFDRCWRHPRAHALHDTVPTPSCGS